MSFSFTFSTLNRYQRFEFSRTNHGLSFTRTSNASTSTRWFAFNSDSYLDAGGSLPGSHVSSSRHFNFSRGRSSENYALLARETAAMYSSWEANAAESDLFDSQTDGFYNYEDDVPVAPHHPHPWATPALECACGDPACDQVMNCTQHGCGCQNPEYMKLVDGSWVLRPTDGTRPEYISEGDRWGIVGWIDAPAGGVEATYGWVTPHQLVDPPF